MSNTLYRNADWIITMNDDRERLRHADILVEGKEIKAIGKDLKSQYPDVVIDKEIDATGMIITPGFVNTHHHTWQSSHG